MTYAEKRRWRRRVDRLSTTLESPAYQFNLICRKHGRCEEWEYTWRQLQETFKIMTEFRKELGWNYDRGKWEDIDGKKHSDE